MPPTVTSRSSSLAPLGATEVIFRFQMSPSFPFGAERLVNVVRKLRIIFSLAPVGEMGDRKAEGAPRSVGRGGEGVSTNMNAWSQV